jgi:hypothetical protein
MKYAKVLNYFEILSLQHLGSRQLLADRVKGTYSYKPLVHRAVVVSARTYSSQVRKQHVFYTPRSSPSTTDVVSSKDLRLQAHVEKVLRLSGICFRLSATLHDVGSKNYINCVPQVRRMFVQRTCMYSMVRLHSSGQLQARLRDFRTFKH